MVRGRLTGEVGKGLLVFFCAQKGDDLQKARKLASRIVRFRVFPNELGRMDKNLTEAGGALLVVSQFTLGADTSHGLRPGFDAVAPFDEGKSLYEGFVAALSENGASVQTGIYGEDMQVSLVNDGPVTFSLTA